MNPPYFFVFDGLDGAGKTTQITQLVAWLEQRGQTVRQCRDPGTTGVGERIRDLLLNAHELTIGFRSEMLLYMAARAQLVDEVIRPSLEAGETVVSDRFLLANVVYQGYAGGLSPDQLWQVGRVATDGLAPTLTFVLDVDPATAAARRQSPPDRLESRGLEYFRKVRAGFLAEAARTPDSIALIDANLSADRVFAQIVAAAERAMGSQGASETAGTQGRGQ